MSKPFVLDSSALLCLLNGERGEKEVAGVLPDAAISSVNLAEVVSKLREHGLDSQEVRDALGGLNLDVRPFTAEQAQASGDLRPSTRSLGLSLGDRACLALALELGATALTTDRNWRALRLDVEIRVLR